MSTTTIERTVETAPAVAAPLTTSETNSLIALAVSAQPTPRVPGTRGSQRESRAWQLGGRVD